MRRSFFPFFDNDSDDEFLLEATAESKKKITESYLFDCSVHLSIDTQEYGIHQPNVLETALMTVVSHTLFKNKEWSPMGYPLYYILNQRIRPDQFTWTRHDNRRVYDGKAMVSGRFIKLNIELNSPKMLYNTVSYNGCVQNSEIYLEYQATTFLSSVTSTGDNAVFEAHGFHPTEIPCTNDNNKRKMYGILDVHDKKNRVHYDHDLAWSTVADYLREETEKRINGTWRNNRRRTTDGQGTLFYKLIQDL